MLVEQIELPSGRAFEAMLAADHADDADGVAALVARLMAFVPAEGYVLAAIYVAPPGKTGVAWKYHPDRYTVEAHYKRPVEEVG